MSNRTLVSLVLGIAASAFFLWLAFRDVDFMAMWHSLDEVKWGWVPASVLLSYLGLATRAARWRFLLVAYPGTPFKSLLSATFIGMMANNILPARVGEVVRAWVLSRREALPVSAALASIVLERMLDVLAALAILGGCLMLSGDLGHDAARLLRRVGFAVLVVSLAGMIVLLLLVRYQNAIVGGAQKWAARIRVTWVAGVIGGLGQFLEGLNGFRDGRRLVTLAGFSLLTWAIAIASFQMVAEGLDLRLSIVQMSLVFVIVLFGVAIPSAPGFVGTFHGFCVAGLALVAGTDATPAATFATLVHGVQWLGVTVAGLLFLALDGSFTWAHVARFSKGHSSEESV